jgi:hypothetical protein
MGSFEPRQNVDWQKLAFHRTWRDNAARVASVKIPPCGGGGAATRGVSLFGPVGHPPRALPLQKGGVSREVCELSLAFLKRCDLYCGVLDHKKI